MTNTATAMAVFNTMANPARAIKPSPIAISHISLMPKKMRMNASSAQKVPMASKPLSTTEEKAAKMNRVTTANDKLRRILLPP